MSRDYQKMPDDKPKSGGLSAWFSGFFSKKSALDELAGQLPGAKTPKKSTAAVDGAEQSLLPKGPK